MEYMRSESVDKLFPRLHEIQRHLTGVTRDAKNDHFGNRYATLEAVMDTVRPVLADNELFLTQLPQGDKLITLLCHASGQYIGCATDLLNKKGDAQGMGSAITYARRYAAMAILGLAPEDDDGNAASSPPPVGELDRIVSVLREMIRSKCEVEYAKDADHVVSVALGRVTTFSRETGSIESAKTLFSALNKAGSQYGWAELKGVDITEAGHGQPVS